MGILDDSSIPNTCKASFQTNRIQQQLQLSPSWPTSKPTNQKLNKSRVVQLSSPVQLKGGCSCDEYKYKLILYHPTELQHCYCQLCRKMSGSAFMTWIPVEKTDFSWVKDPPLVRTTSHGRSHICDHCSGVLTIIYDSQPEVVWIAAGGLDDSLVICNDFSKYLRCVIHICCEWKQDWYTIPDDNLVRVKYSS